MIRHILFDLDNTLYPSTSQIDSCITRRMISFIADYLHISFDEAEKLRAQRLPQYGTTLEWLRAEKNLTDAAVYFDAVHPPEEINELDFDPNLRPLLQSLGLPMTILTNAPSAHAKRILEFFNIADLFLGVYDIEMNSLRGKPYPESYVTAVEKSGYSIENSVFFDDHLKYIKGYAQLGGKAVLIDASGKYTAEKLAGFKPAAVISSVYDVPALLKKNIF